MATRSSELQDVLDAAREAYRVHARDPRSVASLARIFGALDSPAEPGRTGGTRLPVCDLLPAAADPARFADPSLRRLVETFLRLEPALTWRRRGGEAPNASPDFVDGHANAVIAGPGGLENRHDVWLGVSLVAPGVRYPDHHHAPEETYLVLSRGAFRQGDGPWFEPGIGGSFHNTPDILHAMRADDEPLFAWWALWSG
ncbi:putative transcriptional regulator protein [Rubellimicrobium mesophilum DSM 19309]|uniref:Putative transcriptional regulator protein n=1 Tax=Rubellimicrobium mesophilum DSM 19309 TaxID=442562 RepID=A0A017HL39_9RHOB|nr:dimethylsulfonioproprionate lyase family protein [Rubellimicrobium mesophilum]EYD75222.1 putative transcriptional regulator protein [Rubellimicrobium mesophilum DSM 19309]